ncbi:cupin domain-containing protein [Prescottella agglutinans]|uniref:Quercetin dioxygenase-like cupin family protein n=1 Tax=Prescottella agglutinans TaxID=1644129 RepID=A0ABT6MJ44_9NOCA|nr:cupin domain-containing protein [Prescottella agglutinans]MDH6283821.1 quercetin dioxygenase-like cupin family protein [Prescottella agglutinans]
MAEETGMVHIEGLSTFAPKEGPTPRIERLSAGPGATVVRLSFAAGQILDDHKAASPIIVQGVSGRVTFETGGSVVTLEPGVAVNLDAGIVHRLEAAEDSVVVLFVLR